MENNNIKMIDVGNKDITLRIALASGTITMSNVVVGKIKDKKIKKGDVLATAKVGAIMAVKKTPDFVPLCHLIGIDGVDVEFQFVGDDTLSVTVTVKSNGKTGVEMEALTGVSAALLCVYDMCKYLGQRMEIGEIKLEEKSGGKSGHYLREKTADNG